MRQVFSPHNCRLFFRGILIFSVLAGLLFSGGEGIRLFPFPATDTTLQKSFSRNGAEKILYQKNVHRFETKQESQSKFQRHHPSHWAGSCSELNDSPFKAAVLLKSDFSIDPEPVKTLDMTGSRSGRAPPVSESL